MIKTSSILIILVTLVFFSHCITNETEGKNTYNYKDYEKIVTVLDKLNFNNFIKNNKISVVMFYSPNCQRCRDFEPHFTATTENLNRDTVEIKLAKVNVSEEPDLAKEFKVERIPTVLIFNNNDPSNFQEYTGEKTRLKLERHLRRMGKILASELFNEEQIEQYLDSYDAFAVYNGQPEGTNFETFQKAIGDEEFDDLHFYYCKLLFCSKSVSTTDGEIVIFKTFEDKKSVLKSGFSENQVKEFIRQSYFPDVYKFDPIIFYTNFEKKFPGLYYYRSESNTPQEVKDNNYNVLKSISHKTKTFIKSVIVDSDSTMGEIALSFTGVNKEDLPAVFIYDTRKEPSQKFNFGYFGNDNGIFNETQILTFIEHWQNNRLTPDLKSETKEVAAKAEKEENITYLIGYEFDDFVNSKDKDVFIMFYDNDCKTCSQHLKAFAEVAAKFLNNKEILFAKFNHSKNDTLKKYTEYYPAFIFWPAETKEHIIYKGNYSYEEMVNFIVSTASNAVFNDDL